MEGDPASRGNKVTPTLYFRGICQRSLTAILPPTIIVGNCCCPIRGSDSLMQ